MSRSGPDYTIAVVDRALDVLEALAESDDPLGATEIARSIGSTKSSVYRILATLEGRGYIVKDVSSVQYRLGTRLTYLGQRALEGFDLRQRARPYLEELNRKFNETVNLGVLDGHEVAYIDMIESDHELRMAAHLGSRDPAYSTSIGKAILAYIPADELQAHLPAHLQPRTKRTITDVELLRRELDQIRISGVAEDRGENEEGARCFGSPVLDHTGFPVAAVSVSVPLIRLNDLRSRDIADAVRSAALRITSRIGGRESESLVAAK